MNSKNKEDHQPSIREATGIEYSFQQRKDFALQIRQEIPGPSAKFGSSELYGGILFTREKGYVVDVILKNSSVRLDVCEIDTVRTYLKGIMQEIEDWDLRGGPSDGFVLKPEIPKVWQFGWNFVTIILPGKLHGVLQKRGQGEDKEAWLFLKNMQNSQVVSTI